MTTILSGIDSYGVAADITSDGGGPYSSDSYLTANGYNGIAYGDWQFNKGTTTSRKISFSLLASDPLTNDACATLPAPCGAVLPGDPHFTAPAKPPFWGTQVLVGQMEVKCTFLSKSMLTMTAGSVMTCPLLPKFTTSAGTELSLSLGPSFTGFPETTDIQIRCNAVETTVAPVGCNDWYLDPLASAQAGVARLAGTTKGGATIDHAANYGDFYIRFHFHITRP